MSINTVGFYNNHDFDGQEDIYVGTIAIPGGLMLVDSIQLWGDPSWLVCYNKDNYEGDYLKVDKSLSDLNKVDRGSDGDWKNQISSFILYAEKPDFWDTNNRPSDLLPVHPTQVLFAENTHLSNLNHYFTTPSSETDLNTVDYTNAYVDMKNNIQSVRTGTSVWLVVYDETGYSGNQLRMYPDSYHLDLGSVERGSSGDWKNQIQSFQAFDSKPVWDLSFNLSQFRSLFPGNIAYSDYITYTTQDAEYKIHDPEISFPDDLTLQLAIKIEYMVGLSGSNDVVNLLLEFSGDGSLTSTTYNYDGGSAFQIPDQVVTLVDKTVEVAGAVGALETAGISEEAAESFVETFDTAVTVFNDVTNAIYNYMQTDDGRFYLVPVVSHVIARACMSLSNS